MPQLSPPTAVVAANRRRLGSATASRHKKCKKIRVQSICPAAKLAEWIEDRRAATICVARPLNAMVAWLHDEPLTRGVTHRWSIAPAYRHDPKSDVADIITQLERREPCRWVACVLAPDARILSGLLWRKGTLPAAVCACESKLPACPASAAAADPIWGLWGLETSTSRPPLRGRLFDPLIHP